MNSQHFIQTLNENAAIVLRQIRQSRKDMINRVLPALSNQNWIPLHDENSNCYTDDTLPEIQDMQYINKSDITNAIDIMNIENNPLLLSISINEEGNDAHVFNMTVADDKLYIDDTMVCDLTDTVTDQSGKEYVKVLKSVNYLDNDSEVQVEYIDDMFHQVLQADEINQVSEASLEYLARGEELNADAISLISTRFKDAMTETGEYIKQIAESISYGNTGFLNLLQNMYKKVSGGSTVDSKGNIHFTNNDNYVTKNFTSGIISWIGSTIDAAWTSTKSVLAFIGASIGIATYALGKAIQVISNAILDNFTKSKLDYAADNRLYAFGVLQFTLSRGSGEFPGVYFDQLYDLIKTWGIMRFYVPWGTISMWINVDDTYAKIYTETKLRTDITNIVNLPFDIKMPNNANNLNSYSLVSGCTGSQNYGSYYFYHDSGSISGGINPQSSYLVYYKPLNKTTLNISDVMGVLDACITVNPISNGSTFYSETQLATRVYYAYILLLSFLLIIESRQKNSITRSVSFGTDMFQSIATNHPEDLRVFALSYSIGLLLCKLKRYTIIGTTYVPMTDNNCWSIINNNYTCAHLAGSTYYIWDYQPIGLGALTSLMNDNSGQVYHLISDLDIRSNDDGVYSYYTELSDNDRQQVFIYMHSMLYCNSEFSDYAKQHGYNFNCIYSWDQGICYGSPFVTPPNYTRDDLIAGAFLIVGVVAGLAAIISIPTMLIKRRFAMNATLRTAKVEKAWSNAVDDPTMDNIKAYRRLVRVNNKQSKLFGGQIFSKSSYWGENDNVSYISSIGNLLYSEIDIKNSEHSVNLNSLYKLIRG